jgi:phosphatidyl-N-methylethanolamine N-methyltransferase
LAGIAGQTPVLLQRLFYMFKAIQVLTFAGWCYYFARGPLESVRQSLAPSTIGAMLLIFGQTLNWTVFYRLGTSGVFYGNRFGYEIPWCYDFPFSLFDHPQYLGSLASIWGFFIVGRFPYPDWYLLPVVETVYYSLGAWLEG